MIQPAKLNAVAAIATICSFLSLLGSWPLEWFGTGVLARTIWIGGLLLIPISLVCYLVSIGLGIYRGTKAHARSLVVGVFLLVAAGSGWFLLFSWLGEFE
jgi:hypothetical protein